MKTKLNLVAMFLGAVLLALPAAVQAQFTYTTNADGSLNITGYTGDPVMVIPATINDLPVTSLGENAFAAIPWLHSASIPDSVTDIADSAFTASLNLANIDVDPANPAFSSIDGALFDKTGATLLQYPIGLTNSTYTISNSVITIGTNAFFDCVNLTRVIIGTNVASVDDYAFGNCEGIANTTIPNSVTNIGIYAFADCTNFTSLTIPNSVTSIGVESFGLCTGLINVTLSTNLSLINTSAFYYCTRLAHITIPSSVTTIGGNAFAYCQALNSNTIPGSVTNIGDYAFYSCFGLKGIYFLGNAPSLGLGVFGNDPPNTTVYYLPGTSGWSSPFGNLTAVMLNAPNPAGSLKVTLSPGGAITAGARWQVDGGVVQPSGATVTGLSVGTHTVSFGPANGWAMPPNLSVTVKTNLTTLTNGIYGQLAYTTNNGTIALTGYYGPGATVVFPSTINGLPVTSIANYAFDFDNILASVTIPNSITNLGDHAFDSSFVLTNINIGNGVTSIGTNAFYRCYLLASVTFGTNLISIEDYAFDQCSSLSKVILPDSVTSIGRWAFGYCNLTSATIGNGVTNLADYIFYDCSSLATVTIGTSVANVGNFVFEGCPRLKGVYFQGDLPIFNSDVFTGDTNAILYNLPWAKGWGPPGNFFWGRPTALWLPQMQTSPASFGALSNSFGFNIMWASNPAVVIQVCTNLATHVWTPVGTNTLTGGSSHFSDPKWTNYPGRFYRLRWP